MTLDELLERLREEADGEAFLVGGCVRDGLMGRPFLDLDLAVVGAEGYARRLDGTLVPLGERFGTWRVVMGPWTVDVSELQGSIEEDLARRDFTVNAMARALGEQRVIDPFGGLADLERGLVRMVSPENLSADPVRLLRGVRLAAELGFSLDQTTEEAIGARVELLARAAPERQREELCRILAANNAAASLELMDRLGLLAALLPDLVVGKGVEQPREHHWDVFDHQIETVAAVEAVTEGRASRAYLKIAADQRPFHPGRRAVRQAQDTAQATSVQQARAPAPHDPAYFERPVGNVTRGTLLKLTALLHDVGKPATKSVQPNGRVRFFGHSELGAEMVQRAMVRLRFSEQQTRLVTAMVTHHLRPGQWGVGGLPTKRALYRYFRDLGEVAVDTIFLNLADHLAARGPDMDPDHWRAHVAIAEYALGAHARHEEKARGTRLVTGHDVMEEFGLEPGPLIGELLGMIDEAWRTGEIRTREEALALVRGRLNP